MKIVGSYLSPYVRKVLVALHPMRRERRYGKNERTST